METIKKSIATALVQHCGEQGVAFARASGDHIGDAAPVARHLFAARFLGSSEGDPITLGAHEGNEGLRLMVDAKPQSPGSLPM